MTLLGRLDSDEANYLDYGRVETIAQGLKGLFKRVVFNVTAGNRDDHLRNHGFICTPDGWRLSPVFDMDPSLKKDEHVLALDSDNRTPDLEVVLKTAEFYRLSEGEAREIIEETCHHVAGWGKLAQRIGISAAERADAVHLFIVAAPWST